MQGAHTHANIPQFRDRIFVAAFLDFEKLEKFSFPGEVQLTKTIDSFVDRAAKVDEQFYYLSSSRYYDSLAHKMKDDTAIYRIDDSGVATRAWRICPTLKANMGTYRDRVPILRDIHGIRKITPAECLALQGFPKNFNFPDIPMGEIYKQLGNTVCVPVVMRIARRILAMD